MCGGDIDHFVRDQPQRIRRWIDGREIDTIQQKSRVKDGQPAIGASGNTNGKYSRPNANLDQYSIVEALKIIRTEFARLTRTEHVRIHIMEPTEDGKRRITHQCGMDGDPDSDMLLPLDAGCTGQAFVFGRPVLADIAMMKRMFARWRMTPAHRDKIPEHLNVMLSVPVFADYHVNGTSDPIANLSADSATPLDCWENTDVAAEYLQQRAKEVSRILGRIRIESDG